MAGSPQSSRPDTVRHSPRLGPAADPNPQKRQRRSPAAHDGAAAAADFLPLHRNSSCESRSSDGSPSSKRSGGRRREPLAGGSASPLAPRDSRPAPASAPAAACAGAASSSLGRAVRPPPIRTRASFDTNGSFDDGDLEAVPLRAGAAAMAPPSPRNGGGRRRRGGASEMSLIAPRLYIGGEVAARSLEMLQARGVTHALNCCTLPNFHEGDADGPEYLRLGLLDSVADLPRMMDALRLGVAFIADGLGGGGTVFVHCHRGISRSCTLVIAYLMRARGASAEATFDDVRRARGVCDPNLGYLCTLKEWERLDDDEAGTPAAADGGGAAAAPARAAASASPRRSPAR